MRVCLISVEIFAWGKYGGFGRATRLIGRELKKRGLDVTAVVPRREDQRPEEVCTPLAIPGGDLYDLVGLIDLPRVDQPERPEPRGDDGAQVDAAGDHEAVEHVNEVLTMHMGPEDILVNLSVDFIEGATAEEVEASVTQLDRQIKENLPRVKRVFIEAEARRT